MLQIQLMQKEPSGGHTDVPPAAGSHFSVMKHLHSTACLQSQWYPQTHIFPFIPLAKRCQFLERSTACSPFALDLLFLIGQDKFFSGSRLERLLIAMVKERLVVVPVLYEATAPTATLSFISSAQEARGQLR